MLQLTYPGCGVIGEMGVVIVDETTGEVVAWTLPQEMHQAVERLYQEHKEKIETAFNPDEADCPETLQRI
jgi:hypothetical protein